MLRFHPIANAKAAETYYSKSDGGYYLAGNDLRREWVGTGAEQLGLSGTPDFDQFKRLIRGHDPHTGNQLTAKLIEHRIPAWDVTASIPKGVTIALESGDTRIQDALWAAARETVVDLEQYATTRVRKDGQQADRLTGNLVGFAVEHPETRPAKDDGMPDPDRHIHMVLFNLTYDQVEDEWKAVKFRPIMDLRKYFDRCFDMRLASKLADLGYDIETKYQADGRGGKRYFSWDIRGLPQTVVTRFSRRAAEVDQLATKLGIETAAGKDKLAATSRLVKRKDLTLENYRKYWFSRITPQEDHLIAEVIASAQQGENSKPENTTEKAIRFAIDHHFERSSVVNWHDLAITAMERSMGAALPEDIEPQARRQGILLRNGEATTQEVLAEEQRIIGFARSGRGVYQPMAASHAAPKTVLDGLSTDQQTVVQHIWQSPDQVILIEGDAGTGKTDAMKVTIPGIDKPGVFLAPSASASRDTLREKGFANADTIARFLVDPRFREQARDGFIYIDEAPLAGLRDIDAVFQCAKALNARVILQGDRKQHKSIQRGNLFEILDQYAGLPVGRLTQNWRQQHAGYQDAVNAIAKGDILDGYDQLAKLGWVRQTPSADPHAQLIADYLAARNAKKSVLVIAPTHAEGDEITSQLRAKLQERGIISSDEQVVEQLRPLGWTDAEKGDPARYGGTEVLQFHRNAGPFRAGDRIGVETYPGGTVVDPAHFAVYKRSTLALARGDVIRITANGKDKSGKHRLDNGRQYTVAGFTKEGDIALNNGWILAKDFGHLTYNYVNTSHASQGQTVDRVLIAMGRKSLPAMSREQFYVSVSRGRERATIYSDLSPTQLREAVQKHDTRKSATELMNVPKPNLKGTARAIVARARRAYVQLREKAACAIRETTSAKGEQQYAR
jgi:conjugative relaxase-like TrwC/TraI family protein